MLFNLQKCKENYIKNMTMKYLVKRKVYYGPFMWTNLLLTARDQMAGIGASVA